MGFSDKEIQRNNSAKESMNEKQGKVVDSIVNSNPNKSVVVPVEREAKSKRVNLLIKPSTYDKLQEKCKEINVSMNESINQLIENWINV